MPVFALVASRARSPAGSRPWNAVIRSLFALGVLALIPLGCGAGDPPPGDPVFTGAWFLFRIDVGGTCGDAPELGVPVGFAQTGSDVSMTLPDTTFAGIATGTTATLAGELVLIDIVAGRYVRYSSILLDRTGDTITGTAVVRESASPSGFPVTCEGVAMLKAVPEMRVVDFNLDGAVGTPLNNALVFTFTQDVDMSTVTPDTVQVTGPPSAFFEFFAVDERRLALIPQVPNFSDFTDAGLAPATAYNVNLTDYLDPSSIRSTLGAPLARTYTSMFSTPGNAMFVEPSRRLVHAPGPFAMPPGLGDEDGCLNNAGNSLYAYPGIQTGSGASATLLCFVNEGPPHVVPESCVPRHDDRAVGLGGTSGPFTLPAIRIRCNEPVNPQHVETWDAGTMRGLNVQLWRVGDVAGNPIPLSAANQVATNRPVVVQDSVTTEVILVATAPQPSGTYLVNVRSLTDLPGNPLVTVDRPDPAVGGYAAIDASLAGVVPDGYRYYFRTP